MLIYAHRGASHDFPEMSRAAYLGAIEQSADGFECDLRLTRDRVLICWHDENLKRIADSPLVVAKSTLAELQRVCEIFTFDELLELAITHKKNLALETKHPVPSGGLVETLLLEKLDSRKVAIGDAGIEIAIMSFSLMALRRLKKAPYTKVYLIAHRWQRVLGILSKDIFSAFGPGIFLLRDDPSFAAKLRSKRDRLFIWTVNSAPDLEIAQGAGASVVISDKPGQLKG